MSVSATVTGTARELALTAALAAIGLCAAAMPPDPAGAVEIRAIDAGEQVPIAVVLVTGPVEPGDASRFEDEVAKLATGRATIVLSGPGGMVDEALSIGAIVKARRFATLVLPDMECLSACALIWLSGERRYLSERSYIGVHAAYRFDEMFAPRESGIANADIGAYLSTLGLPRDAIRYIATAPPSDFQPITPQIARRLGIDVYEQHGLETVSPQQAPTVHAIASQVAELVAIAAICSDLFGINPEEVREVAADMLQRGHQQFDGAAFAGVIAWMPDYVKGRIAEEGNFAWCLDAEARLREQGVTIGIDSPSFDCSGSSSPGERLICAQPTLWASDRAMDAIYETLLAQLPVGAVEELQADQREWLTSRERCGSDANCIELAYSSRISLMVALADLLKAP